jgi:hypothetical protein
MTPSVLYIPLRQTTPIGAFEGPNGRANRRRRVPTGTADLPFVVTIVSVGGENVRMHGTRFRLRLSVRWAMIAVAVVAVSLGGV